jgi:colicin import membrane protein
MSVLLHGALIGVLVYGYLQFRRPPPPVTALAIDATVVSQSTLDAARRPAPSTPAPPAPAPAPTPPPEAEQVPPPPPDPAVKLAAQQAEAAHEAAAAKAEAVQAKAAADREAAKQAAAAQQREAAEAQAKEKEKAEREAKAKAKAAEQAEAQAKVAAAAKAQVQAQAAASQAELQKSIAAEERLDAARNSGAMSSWAAQIQARIQRAWIRPPSARSGLDCTLYVTQVPGGEIVNVKLGSCNGDDAVKQSILDAAYRASPLPPPPDPALFERNLELYFRPTD